MKKNLIIALFFALNIIGFAQTKEPVRTIIANPSADSAKKVPILPGDYNANFSAEQDSAFKKALRLNIPGSSRFQLDLKRFAAAWQAFKRMEDASPWSYALGNMNIPQSMLAPRSFEIAQREVAISKSFYVPGTNAYNSFNNVVTFGAIASFLGLVEDVSPVIRYNIDYSTEIEVVIYSMQAQVIATIFNGVQAGGKYSYTWNLRDDKGRKMPPGDYIAEVRIGKERYVRKRIVIYP